ncbi:hypothetical protein DV736_g314, partial [Chaetothyriales sp. CBS 134916]
MASSEAAPAYSIPPRQVVTVEHPCIIRNIDRAIDMLGGPASVKQMLAPGPAKPLGLNLQPSNPDSRPILSFNNQANNVLLQIRVPKRIGKRKRGSEEPFVAVDSADVPRNARYLVQSMRDNATNHQVEALGTIEQTHIWREMPDFVFSTQGTDFLSKVRSQLLPRELQSLKSFNMHRRHGLLGSEAVPPPVLSTVSLPHQANYRQDTSNKAWPPPSDHPNSTEAAVSNNLRTSMTSVTSFADSCPMSANPSLPPLSLQSKAIRELQPLLVDLFKERALWTRRALVSRLPPDASSDRLRFTLPYVSFLIRAGPWRHCLCRFGIDPTSSPDFRIYQTVRIKATGSKTDDASERGAARNTIPAPHIFTGTHPHPRDGSIWQLCDIADPQLTPLVNLPTHELPSHCDTRCFGWYPNGALSKIRTVMKAKLDACTAQQQQQQQQHVDTTVFDRFLTLLPNKLDHFDSAAAEMGDPNFGYLPPPMTPLEMELAASYRGISREGMNKELRRAERSAAPVERKILQ